MEGITLYPLRNIHKEIFGDSVDRYFTPFVTAPKTFHFKNREKKDILPDKNESFENYGYEIVPQIMAGNAQTFLWAAREMKKLGYSEVNLNLGCPAPTVVNRHKGAGLLQDTEYLDEMLRSIFDEVMSTDGITTEKVVTDLKPSSPTGTDNPVHTDDSRTPTIITDMKSAATGIDAKIYPKISIKTRLGFYSEDEAPELMSIFARYPIKELIVHARLREDYYAGKPRVEAFRRGILAYKEAGGNADICYNGNVNSLNDYRNILEFLDDESKTAKYISSVMIGRGLLSDPALVRRIKGGSPLLQEELRQYLKRLYEAYAEYIPEERNVIFKLLEHWAFLHVHFENCDKYLKAIRKSRTKGEYFAAVNNIFSSCRFI